MTSYGAALPDSRSIAPLLVGHMPEGWFGRLTTAQTCLIGRRQAGISMSTRLTESPGRRSIRSPHTCTSRRSIRPVDDAIAVMVVARLGLLVMDSMRVGRVVVETSGHVRGRALACLRESVPYQQRTRAGREAATSPIQPGPDGHRRRDPPAVSDEAGVLPIVVSFSRAVILIR